MNNSYDHDFCFVLEIFKLLAIEIMILASFLRIKQTYNMCIKVNTYYSTLNLEQLMYLEHSSCR